jgi:hypothetical protein
LQVHLAIWKDCIDGLRTRVVAGCTALSATQGLTKVGASGDVRLVAPRAETRLRLCIWSAAGPGQARGGGRIQSPGCSRRPSLWTSLWA